MNLDFEVKSFFTDLIFGLVSYGWFRILRRLIKEARKLKACFNLTDNSHIITNLKDLKEAESSKLWPFVFIKGKSEKIYTRAGNYLNKDIILSNGNSLYLEDFFLKIDGGKVIVQPNKKMQFNNFDTDYIKMNTGVFSNISKFLFNSESPVLKENQELILFGEINKSSDSNTSEFRKYINISPEFIERNSDLNSFIVSLRSIQINKTFFIAASLLVFTGVLMIFFNKKYWNRIKKLKFNSRLRKRIYCLKCNLSPCHVYCENCQELSEYCYECFKKFQDEIDEGKLILHDIKCSKCFQVMEFAQYLVKN